jgi:ATP-binding cassette subfamily F protein 3
VVELRHAVKRYGELTVYSGVSLEIERGSRIALVGPNGAGKSTMIRMLAGVDDLTAGERIVGDKVVMGYFAQNLAESLDYDGTVLDELSRSAQGMTSTEIRNLLGAMLFSGDEVQKRVGVLSGGERARLALAKVIARRNNCLLLDEPTNNLDIVAKETLLEALRRFPGTVVIVSHDRHILNQLVTQVIEVGHGHAVRYLGNYDDYLAKKAQEESRAAQGATAAKVEGARSRLTQVGSSVAVEPATNGVAPATSVNGNASAAQSAPPHRASSNGGSKPAGSVDREADRRRSQNARKRAEIEAVIERKETERAALATEMNDANFYLVRKDAKEMIARYELLDREIEKLYEDLVGVEDSGAAK